VARPATFLLPWFFLLIALLLTVPLINGTAPAACEEIPNAYGRGVHTEPSGDRWGLVSRCKVTDRPTGLATQRTVVNWTGIIASIAGCIGAWFLGAAIGGLLDRKRAFVVASIALLTASGAMVLWFAGLAPA
jgi:hypothetical protein